MEKTENKKYKVLLIDDDEYLVDMYSLKFEKGGLDVSAVFSGEQALNKLRENHFDIIVMDLIMPVMDGFELLETIRKEKLADDSAIIILSNQGQKSDIDRVEKLSVDGYVVKASTIPSEVLEDVIKIADKKFNN
ncbi:response regulator [Patescibacteria group bacterium]|nr:response regulator [Patescibacteria group bacterium]MCG2694605.1 response regulator [Candidatus Parcubacteria bacterium]